MCSNGAAAARFLLARNAVSSLNGKFWIEWRSVDQRRLSLLATFYYRCVFFTMTRIFFWSYSIIPQRIRSELTFEMNVEQRSTTRTPSHCSKTFRSLWVLIWYFRFSFYGFDPMFLKATYSNVYGGYVFKGIKPWNINQFDCLITWGRHGLPTPSSSTIAWGTSYRRFW